MLIQTKWTVYKIETYNHSLSNKEEELNTLVTRNTMATYTSINDDEYIFVATFVRNTRVNQKIFFNSYYKNGKQNICIY